MSAARRPLKVAFFHPDLGIGGAERLIVDAAAALAAKGHEVTVYTSHYEAARSFAETRSGLFEVKVHGDWMPRQILGGFHIVWAILRAVWLACVVALTEPEYDVFICDQVSAYVPVLRFMRPPTPVLFYCHFPDQLLSSRGSVLKQLYRKPFDAFERSSTAAAQEIVVNSNFTRGVVERTFGPALAGHRLAVLYPCIDVPASPPPTSASAAAASEPIVFLSINRYERKKAIELAIDAFARMRATLPAAAAARVHLVVAGGYDIRVAENVGYHVELKQRAAAAGLFEPGLLSTPPAVSRALPDFPPSAGASAPAYQQVEALGAVTFIRSFSDAQKGYLLRAATAVLYTPSNEHFGIVPIEAMAGCRPVVAVNNGGPLESVVDGRTGYLCEPTVEAFAAAMEKIALNPAGAAALGAQGFQHVRDTFSREEFGRRLDACCVRLAAAAAAQAHAAHTAAEAAAAAASPPAASGAVGTAEVKKTR